MRYLRLKGYVELKNQFDGDRPDLMDAIADKNRMIPDLTFVFRMLIGEPRRLLVNMNPGETRYLAGSFVEIDDLTGEPTILA